MRRALLLVALLSPWLAGCQSGPRMSNLVAFYTDFGINDPYVGQLKGAVKTVHPSAELLDLSPPSFLISPTTVRPSTFRRPPISSPNRPAPCRPAPWWLPSWIRAWARNGPPWPSVQAPAVFMWPRTTAC
ncbi:hypothetical protein EBT23_01325 [bacterium]|nr:hypothetical protein [bacterium]